MMPFVYFIVIIVAVYYLGNMFLAPDPEASQYSLLKSYIFKGVLLLGVLYFLAMNQGMYVRGRSWKLELLMALIFQLHLTSWYHWMWIGAWSNFEKLEAPVLLKILCSFIWWWFAFIFVFMIWVYLLVIGLVIYLMRT